MNRLPSENKQDLVAMSEVEIMSEFEQAAIERNSKTLFKDWMLAIIKNHDRDCDLTSEIILRETRKN